MIYVLHIEPPFRHARHYIGFTDGSPEARLEAHLAGRGSPLIRAAVAAGRKVTLACTFPGSRRVERRVKNRKNGPKFCRICNP